VLSRALIARTLPQSVRVPTVVPSLQTSFSSLPCGHGLVLRYVCSHCFTIISFQMISSCPCWAHEGPRPRGPVPDKQKPSARTASPFPTPRTPSPFPGTGRPAGDPGKTGGQRPPDARLRVRRCTTVRGVRDNAAGAWPQQIVVWIFVPIFVALHPCPDPCRDPRRQRSRRRSRRRCGPTTIKTMIGTRIGCREFEHSEDWPLTGDQHSRRVMVPIFVDP